MSASWRSRALAIAAGLAAACLAPAWGQVLFKWTDAEGKVQYSDRAPKNFAGTVERIESEKYPAPTRPPVPAPATAPGVQPVGKGDASLPSAADAALAKRRATRTQLEQRLAQARANVAAAKKALQESESPGDDERQVVQQRAAAGGMHGMAPRSNCREEKKGGMKWMMCPTFVPTPEYHERVARLEEAVRKAEEELADAEQAWKRGVD